MKKAAGIAVLILLVIFSSCRKDKLLKNTTGKLRFTRDSILFDTIFTKIGSTTKLFRVHNDNNGAITISSIRLGRGDASFYRLNIDGVAGRLFSDIEIAAHDSIYVFVEVTIDPNADPSVSPFLYQDQIIFETNGNQQQVQLVSFGQNAYYHFPSSKLILSSTQAIYYDTLHVPLHGTDTWATDKPHLIYGWVVVDSTQTLIIPAGAKIYIHNNGGIWVYKYGTIQINGTYGNEVVFQGDRLEPEYKDLPGQWDRIWINENKYNVINYAIIKNGFIGIQAGNSVLEGLGGNTLPSSPTGTLSLSNTIIQNCSFAGILTKYFNVKGGNNVVSNCGKYLCSLLYGGHYNFTQCTFANYWSQTNNSSSGSQTRTTPSFLFNNYPSASLPLKDSVVFNNCIMDGNLGEEFHYDTIASNNTFYFKYDYDILKTQMDISNPLHFINCFNSSYASGNPSFVNPANYNFHLNNNSAGLNSGDPAFCSVWQFTIDNVQRCTSGAPNRGAY